MATKKKNHLAFMTDSPDGKYQADKPTDEQLAAVLPWLLDGIVTYAQLAGYARTATDFVPQVLSHLGLIPGTDVKLLTAAGLDVSGYDKDGFDEKGFDRGGYGRNGLDRRGFDREGYNADGYNYDGYDRDGFNRNGVNYWGTKREIAVKELVEGWTPEYAALIAGLINKADNPTEEPAEPVAA